MKASQLEPGMRVVYRRRGHFAAERAMVLAAPVVPKSSRSGRPTHARIRLENQSVRIVPLTSLVSTWADVAPLVEGRAERARVEAEVLRDFADHGVFLYPPRRGTCGCGR